MKTAWPFSQVLLLGSIIVAIGAVAVTIFWTNTTLRSVEKNLPITLLRELGSLDQTLDHLSQVAFAAKMHAAHPDDSSFIRLEKRVETAFNSVSSLRRTYVFDNLVQASKFHAVVAPAVSDLQIWLSEGISGYGPRSPTTARILLSRISIATQKARALNRQSRLNAQKKLEDERKRLDEFLSGINLLFMLTLFLALIMVALFIHQHRLTKREIKIQDALETQRDLLNTLFENILLGITVWSGQGRLLFINAYFTSLTGYSLSDIPRVRDWFNKAFPDPSYRQKVIGTWKGAVKEGTGVREFKIRDKEGSIKDIEFRGTIMPDGRILVSMADVTGAKKARAAQRESEKRMRAIFEAVPDPMIMYSRTGAPEYINPSFTRVFGWTLDDLKGEDQALFVPDEERSRTRERLREMYDSGHPMKFETRRRAKDGRILDILLSAAVTKGAKGESEGMVANLTDVTEKKALEAQYEQAQKMESLGTLAGGIAHDFNNLLSGLYGYLDLARLKTKDSRIREYLEKAHKSSERAKGLTYQLLTFSKGGAPVKRVESLVPFIEETARFALSGARVSCSFDLAPDLWMCDYDRNQMGQVIDNIIINAHHAMPSGGNIRVTADNISLKENQHPGLARGNYVKIVISDSGTGIPGKYLSRIFDPFFTTKQKGSGLGLATSYSIVKRHGGVIEVESQLGTGTTFAVIIPASDKRVPKKPAGDEFLYQGSGKILIMDDEPVILEMLGTMLESMGFEVESVNEGTEAVNAWEKARKIKTPFRAVILDLTVPGGLGGRETIKRIRLTDQAIPVFVASGYFEDKVMADPGAFGFTASIHKPFTILDISKVFEKHL